MASNEAGCCQDHEASHASSSLDVVDDGFCFKIGWRWAAVWWWGPTGPGLMGTESVMWVVLRRRQGRGEDWRSPSYGIVIV